MPESPTRTSVSIPLDRDRLDRTWGWLMAGTVLLVALVVGVLTALLLHAGAGLVDVMPVLLVLPLGAAWVVVTFAVSWRRLRRVRVPLELGPEGITLRSPFGEVVAPWSAVASAGIEPRLFGPWLRVRLVPAGYRTTVTRRPLHRKLDAQGFRYALRMLAVDADRLRADFAEQSGGRVTVAG